MTVKIKTENSRVWDCVSLGEVMLRFDPADARIHLARTFQVWEGGGEYNVARGLRSCFGLQTAIVTKLVDNAVGRLIENLIRQGGVDVSLIHWVADAETSGEARNGLNFVERGFGVRAARGVSDRKHTAISKIKTGEVGWQRLFAAQSVKWFHTGGIFAGLSETSWQVAEEAMRAAKMNGVMVSFDLNYRASLWEHRGGRHAAQALNRRLAPLVDVMFGVLGEDEVLSDDARESATSVATPVDSSSNLEVPTVLPLDTTALKSEAATDGSSRAATIDVFQTSRLETRMRETFAAYPNLKAIATTLRRAPTASRNDWSAICFDGTRFYRAPVFSELEIYDRIGGGDSFAAGFIYGLLNGEDYDFAVRCGAAHGALAMTTPGDASMATQAEVFNLMNDASRDVQR